MAPIRVYVRYAPGTFAKGRLTEQLVVPLLPDAERRFAARIDSLEYELGYRESLGVTTLLYGGFERPEIEYLCRRARAGSTAVDAGANVGLFTLPLARAVGPEGRVLAFEPGRDNLDRLRGHLLRNAIGNVTVHAAAVGDANGTVSLALGSDPAFHSAESVPKRLQTGAVVEVASVRIDDVWGTEGEPEVSVVKIDVEGAELAALRGAEELLSTCRPALMIEAHAPSIGRVTSWLGARGYRRVPTVRFQPWNHAFEPERT